MGVFFSEILCNFVANYIDDVRWREELATNPCVWLRAKSQFLLAHIHKFNRPPEIEAYLDDYSPPAYDDFLYVAPQTQAKPITIDTGKTGYDQCSTGLTGKVNGNPYYTPINNEYDPETGNVTIDTDLAEGQAVEIDFYTDGVFNNPLSLRQKRIIGLCVAAGWYEQFANTYLNITPKISDTKFSQKSENAGITANTGRLQLIESKLNGEINAYEHDVAYRNTVKGSVTLP